MSSKSDLPMEDEKSSFPPPPPMNQEMEEQHYMIQQMDPEADKKVHRAQDILTNILDQVKKSDYSTPRAGMKAGIDKLLYFIKDTKDDLDRTVLTMLWGQAQKMVQDFNTCAREEYIRYDKKKRQLQEEIQQQEKEQKLALEVIEQEQQSILDAFLSLPDSLYN